MNGLVIRDYLYEAGRAPAIRCSTPVSTLTTTPKIAPLMWPPLYHVLLGLALLPGRHRLTRRRSAWWRSSRRGRRGGSRLLSPVAGPPLAAVGALLFLLTPIVAQVTSTVMVDVVVAALAIESAHWLKSSSFDGSRRHAVAFGAFAAATCSAKGNGVAVVLMPLAVMAAANRFDLIRQRGLHIARGGDRPVRCGAHSGRELPDRCGDR